MPGMTAGLRDGVLKVQTQGGGECRVSYRLTKDSAWINAGVTPIHLKNLRIGTYDLLASPIGSDYVFANPYPNTVRIAPDKPQSITLQMKPNVQAASLRLKYKVLDWSKRIGFAGVRLFLTSTDGKKSITADSQSPEGVLNVAIPPSDLGSYVMTLAALYTDIFKVSASTSSDRIIENFDSFSRVNISFNSGDAKEVDAGEVRVKFPNVWYHADSEAFTYNPSSIINSVQPAEQKMTTSESPNVWPQLNRGQYIAYAWGGHTTIVKSVEIGISGYTNYIPPYNADVYPSFSYIYPPYGYHLWPDMPNVQQMIKSGEIEKFRVYADVLTVYLMAGRDGGSSRLIKKWSFSGWDLEKVKSYRVINGNEVVLPKHQIRLYEVVENSRVPGAPLATLDSGEGLFVYIETSLDEVDVSLSNPKFV